MERAARQADIKEACLEEALRLIEERGIESLSLRDVARRIGVSHQAPYKHFPSRDHILAELVTRSFDEFATFLQDRPTEADPACDLGAMGLAYLAYARKHPLKYRLMFNTPIQDPAAHPVMMQKARKAFALLRDRLATMPVRPDMTGLPPSANLEALFVWSAIHGLATILDSDVMQTLGLTDDEINHAVARCMARLSLAIDPAGLV